MDEAAKISDEFGTEFIHLSLIDSAYAKVIFQDVKDVFSPDEDLICTYMVASSALPVNAGDTVRLFKVGWSSTDDFEASVSCGDAIKSAEAAATAATDGVSPPASSLCRSETTTFAEMSVTFKALAIPKDDNNFYQFCYITSDGEIRGASTPFLFRITSVDDFVTVNDIESDLLLIQNRTTILEDNLQKTMKEKATIQMDKQNLEKKIKELNAIIEHHEDLLSSMIDMQKKIVEQNDALVATITNEKEELMTAFKVLAQEKEELSATCKEMREKLEDEKKDGSRLMMEIASQGLTIGSLLHQRNVLQSLVDSSEQKIRESKENHAKEQETKLKDHQTMLSRLAVMEASNRLALEKLKEFQEKQLEFQSMQQLKSEIRPESEALKQSKEENCRLQEIITDLQCRLNMAAAEYKRKYIEWYKLDKQLAKLKTTPKKDSVSAGVQSDLLDDKKETSDLKSFDSAEIVSQASKPDSVRSGSSDGQSICMSSLNQNRKTALIAEMEKQLQKFQSSNDSSSYNVSSLPAQQYPYPPFYPYPYPFTMNSNNRQQRVGQRHGCLEDEYLNVNTPQDVSSLQDAMNDYYSDAEFYATPHDDVESFMDNEQSGQQTSGIRCPVCDYQFMPDEPSASIQEHVDDHFVLSCPFCPFQFERETGQRAFNDHVKYHLDS